MKKPALFVAIIALVALGGVGLYYGPGFTGPVISSPRPPASSASSTVSGVQSSPSSSSISTTTTTQGFSLNTSCNASSPAGCPAVSGAGANVPKSQWANFLGFIPAGYTITPKFNQNIVFPCPPGVTKAQCDMFKQTCGNGVCDPNETCQSCPLDCSVPGDLVCDPYTGRPNSPATVCQIGQAVAAAGGGAEGAG